MSSSLKQCSCLASCVSEEANDSLQPPGLVAGGMASVKGELASGCDLAYDQTGGEMGGNPKKKKKKRKRMRSF